MTEETARRASDLLGRISVLKYNNAVFNNMLESGNTSLMNGAIDASIGYDAIVEQIHRNNKELKVIQKEFDKL